MYNFTNYAPDTINSTRVFAESLVGLGFMWSVFYIKPMPTHEKIFLLWKKKSGPIATFNQIFLGFGWPWVGEFVGFIITFTCFPTQQNLVYRKTAYCWCTVQNTCGGTVTTRDAMAQGRVSHLGTGEILYFTSV